MIRCCLIWLFLCLPLSAQAQTQTQEVMLRADRLLHDPASGQIEARGSVVIAHPSGYVQADLLRYDLATGRITHAEGVRLTRPDGAELRAGRAMMDADFANAQIGNLRLVLPNGLEFAAVSAQRRAGRYLNLYKSIASSCQVCPDQPIPLWLIRAERIVRDEEAGQIYLQNARFELGGTPVLWLPRFRIADPAKGRASGFLVPNWRSSDQLGRSLSLPYYIVLSDQADLTIAPLFTNRGTVLVDSTYRRRFAKGTLDMRGALAYDSASSTQEIDAFGSLHARFDIGRGYRLETVLAHSSDKTFPIKFGLTNASRLESRITLSRQTAATRFELSALRFQTLRNDEQDAQLPLIAPQLRWRHFGVGPFAGQITGDLELTGLTRRDGRDMLKLHGGGEWRKSWTSSSGLIAQISHSLYGTVASVSDAGAFSGQSARISGTVAAKLRWPFMRAHEGGLDMIEPVAELVLSRAHRTGPNLPNEDSQAMEFDAANLFALNRFPGNDRLEEGWRLNLGVHSSHFNAKGWNFDLTLGQVLRAKSTNGYPSNTGLNNIRSNLVAAAVFDLPPYLTLSNQTLFDRQFNFSRNDIQLSLAYGRGSLAANYVYLDPDLEDGGAGKHNELSLSGKYQLGDFWTIDAELQRNLETRQNMRSKLGLEYRNDCVAIRFSASRQHVASATLPAATEYGLNIALAGLGAPGAERARRCTGTAVQRSGVR